ncbi:LytTR family DNA-binding domain-containing protein [Nocardioidaceae bacterium]|nr:LytTR family DNA-binding domain-containing protein [Nocardioidaceae bacterium]
MSDHGRGAGLRVLVVDDEAPGRDEVAWLLDRHEDVAEVRTTGSATEALRLIGETEPDAVFLDVQMPGLTGLELAGVLGRFAAPPPVVFVTAHESHAVEAFDLHAVDYVLKPVRPERLAEAVRRVLGAAATAEPVPAPAAPPAVPSVETDPDRREDSEQIPVELGGVTRFVSRAHITHVEAAGDYARLHTAEGSHLLRVPLSTLEEQWSDAGFLRVHRSVLVALHHVHEVRMDAGHCTVVVGRGPARHEVGVSRRHTRTLRDRLVRRSGP